MSDTTRYTKVAITLHWVIALAIIAQLATGIIMGYDLLPKARLFPLYQFHKSLGLSVLVLSLLRLVWRMMHRPPAYPSHMPRWEVIAAKISHYAFYIFMIGVPLTGWLLVSSSSRGLPTIWFGLFEWPNLPGIADLDNKQAVNGVARGLHVYMAYATLALLGLHIAAALKHHFIEHDEVLHRMIPFIKPRVPKAALALALLVFAAAPAHAALWTMRAQNSEIVFRGENAGQKFIGKFETFTPAIDFDPDHLDQSSVKVTIDTASALTGTKTYDSALPQKEWFNVKDFPEAVFVSKSFKHVEGEKYEAAGKLTIKGVTRDITLPFTLAIKDKAATMMADVTIDRLAYGIGKDADPDAEWVSKDIELSIRVEADQK